MYDFWKDRSTPCYSPAGYIRGSINPKNIINPLSDIENYDKYMVSDVISGWESSLGDLMTKWKRNYMIDQILKGDHPTL